MALQALPVLQIQNDEKLTVTNHVHPFDQRHHRLFDLFHVVHVESRLKKLLQDPY
jgi:hypothetical protein